MWQNKLKAVTFSFDDGVLQDQIVMSSDDGGMTWTKRHLIPQTAATAPEFMGKTDCRDPKVFPLLIDDSFGTGEVAEWRRATLSDPPLANLLFVGRLAPNKRHDRLIATFGCYQRHCNPDSRLVIAGGVGGAETYKALLLGDAYVWAARNVVFTDFMDDANLRACYATASAFVCMSDHEGFCAPLLEAMAWHVPVFAWAAGAVPETLDGAGVLFEKGTPPETMAETIHRVLSDPALRAAVVKKQDERLARFRARDAWAELREVSGV